MAQERSEKTWPEKPEGDAPGEILSAGAGQAMAAARPKPRHRRGLFLLKSLAVFLVLVVAALGALFASVENGLFDRELARRAQAALNGALAGNFEAKVGSAALRFSSRMAVAIEARGVEIREAGSGAHVSNTELVRLVIDPVALLSGQLKIGGFEVDGVDVDTALLQTGGGDIAAFRVDSIPQVTETLFARLDAVFAFLDRSQAGDIRLSRLMLEFPGRGKPVAVAVNDVVMERRENGALSLTGVADYRQNRIAFSIEGEMREGRIGLVRARLEGIDLGLLTLRALPDGTLHDGLESKVSAAFTARRAGPQAPAELKAVISATPGTFRMDADPQEFSGAELNLSYDFAKDSVELLPSKLAFGRTSLPVSGAVIDRDRIGQDGAGYALDLLFSGAVSGATDAPPLPFDAKVNGVFDPALMELRADRLMVTSPQGNMGGSFLIRFRPGMSPEISFGGQIPEMGGNAVKQLWPFWMGHKAREWTVGHIFGGKAKNGTISVFIPAGRLKFPPSPLVLDENELRIAFDVEKVRLDLPEDVPPLRDVDGRVKITGGHASVDVASGISYFASGRSVALEPSRFVLPDFYEKPLMGELSLAVAGDAAAVLELSDYKPMNSLKSTDFRPEEFSGPVKATVSARFGLLASQKPPPPDWSARIDLQSVNLSREFGGHRIGEAKGEVAITPQALKVEAAAKVEGAPVEISYLHPLGQSPAKPELAVRGKLAKADWLKLVPQLGEVVDGPLSFEMSRIDEKRQAVKVDLGAAALSLPWIGWSKGAGVPASASFELGRNGDDSQVRNFQLGGDGFGANGNLTFSRNGAVLADLPRVVLSPGDDFGLTLRSGKAGVELAINGKTLDIRHVVRKLKTDYEGEKAPGNGKGAVVTARLNVERLTGFNDETLSGVNARISVKGGKLGEVDFSGVTSSGQAIVSQMLKDRRNTISVTSGDAGAFARFIDLYRNMTGGLLNLRLFAMDSEAWSGSLDIRSFSLRNEQKLQSIVSTPAGADGRSLNKALKRDIDMSSARFDRVFARIVTRNGVLSVENGVLRGEQVGATFQGTVRDRRGNMDLTGTFMPAYGLNRLFAELPIIGTILGNGRDRGLIGITFKMNGKFTRPNLTVNPLSIIAPGVFRQIFEY